MEQGLTFGEGIPPKTIAIVGVSRTSGSATVGVTGLQYLKNLLALKFEGNIYPVNPKVSEIEGVKAYPNLTSIPQPLDLVIIAVPAAAVPQVMEECVKVGARNVQICTSGFGETGEAEGRALNDRIAEIAEKGRLRVIGPNCIGFHIPSARMRVFDHIQMVGGSVAFISQSGGHAVTFMEHVPHFAFGVSKIISYGNALTLDAPHFLEYLGKDPETRVICMYLEGIKNGQRLIELVRQINKEKPVIVWKGAMTESGSRAAASHTSSMAGNRQIWNAFFKQTGAIPVGSIEEMAEVAMSLHLLKPSASKRVAVMAIGGGSTVSSGDISSGEGLELPPLSPQTIAALHEFVSLVNQGVKNPLDVPGVLMYVPLLKKVLDVLVTDPLIDHVILHMATYVLEEPSVAAGLEKILTEYNRQDHGGMNFIIALSVEYRTDDIEQKARELRAKGIPAYGSLRRACLALSRFAGYHKHLARGTGSDGDR